MAEWLQVRAGPACWLGVMGSRRSLGGAKRGHALQVGLQWGCR